jgi:chemotaxis protein histidine kinase CheA
LGAPDIDDDEVARRAFSSRVSTATRVSAISGRGVGLDAIRSLLRGGGGDAHRLHPAPRPAATVPSS